MRQVLVSGGAGFIGSWLCERLCDDGWRVLCVDNLVTGSRANVERLQTRGEAFEFVHWDICTPVPELVRAAVTAHGLDLVMNMACPASPVDYHRMPLFTMRTGSKGTWNLLELARETGATFLMASTSEVYGDPLIHPQQEDYTGNVNPIGPRSVYDESKRFSESLVFTYRREFDLDVRIARIFNSILADEQVLYDDGETLRREKASELAERLAELSRSSQYNSPLAGTEEGLESAVEFPLTGFSVPAFGAGGAVRAARADAFIGHPTNKKCFKLTTRYGRSLKVTEDHSVFTEGREGEPLARPVKALKLGDRIALMKRIEVPERDRSEVDMLEVWEACGLNPWEFYIESPGLGAWIWEHRARAFELLKPHHISRQKRRYNGIWNKLYSMRDNDRVLHPLFEPLGKAVPENARVRMRTAGGSKPLPARIELTDEFLWFLGVWVAEGSWQENSSKGAAYITISSDEQVVRRASDFIRDHLGLHPVYVKPTTGRAPSIFVHSKLLLLLLRFLDLGPGERRIPGWILGLPLCRLKWFIEGYREGDGVHSGKTFEEGKRHEFSTVAESLKGDLIVALARFGLLPSVGHYTTTIRKKTGERRYPFWRLTLCNVSPWSPLEWDGGVEQVLNARTHGDLVWAKITDIEEVPSTPLVYDFSVPGLENFWAGTGVVAHNTYGPRMQVNDGRVVSNFVCQALRGEPLTVYGDGSQTRSFCYVTDTVNGLVKLAQSDYPYPVNIGNPDEWTILTFANEVARLVGKGTEVVLRPLPEDDPKKRRPDITRARAELGWSPQVTLTEGLSQTIEFFRGELAQLEGSEP